MQAFFLPLLFIVGITNLNIVIWNKKFTKVLPIALMESIFILFLSGFINLNIGYILCILLSLAGWLIYPVQYFMVKRTSNTHKIFTLDYEMCVFLIMYIFLFLLNYRKGFMKWDDYSHWGVMAKETLRLNRFYYVTESVVSTHKDYPPLNALLQYLWCRLSGGYAESYLFNAKNIFSFSLLFPLLGEWHCKTTNRWYKTSIHAILTVMILVTLTTFSSIGEALFFRTIYPECILALLFAYGMYTIYFNEEKTIFSVVQFVLIGISILMVKQIGFYFWGVLVAYYFLNSFCYHEKINKKWIISNVLIIGIPFSTWNIWRSIANKYAPIRQFNSQKFSISNLLGFLTGNRQDYQVETFKNYCMNLLEHPLLTRPISLSYIQIMFLCVSIVIAMYFITREKTTRKQVIILGIMQFLGMVGYIAVMLISYLFGFSISESVNVVCFDRYMMTLLQPILLTDGFLFILLLNEKGKLTYLQLQIIFLLCTAVILYPPDLMETELKPGFLCEKKGETYDGDARIIEQYTEENAKIYLICQQDNESGWNIIAYDTAPRSYQAKGFSLGKPYDDTDIFTENISVEDWKQKLANFDYLYLSNVDKQFISCYGEVFPTLNIKNQQVYKINMNNGILKLELLNP